MIFIADNPIDLLDSASAKQYEGFNKQNFKDWRYRRQETLGSEPLKPTEPVAFFDFGEQEKLNIDVQFRSACRYIKVMPTAFRSAPINYAETEIFTENSVEMMFFGISGYEVETLLAEGTSSSDDKNMLMHPSLLVPIDMQIS